MAGFLAGAQREARAKKSARARVEAAKGEPVGRQLIEENQKTR
jgi:hypothetical protein